MRPLCLPVLVLVLSPATAAAAEPDGPDWAFGHPGGEAALAAASAATLATLWLPQLESDWEPLPVRPRHDGWGIASDFVGGGIGSIWQIAGGFGMEAGYYETSDAVDPYERAARTSLVEIESMLLATGATVTIKRLAGRCRPRAWRDGYCAGGEYDGFPSGHTSSVSAVAGARLTLALRSDGTPARRITSFALAESASLAVAVLRVLAGAHSLEDVAVGWGLGHASGAVVSLAHPMERVPVTTIGSQSQELRAEMGWSWAF